jgi:hypothetical protein
MKKSLAIFAIAAAFAACNSNPKLDEKTTATVATEDTAGLAAFKLQQEQLKEDELIQTEGIYDGTNNVNGTAPAVVANNTTRRVSSSPAPARRSTASRTTSRRSSSGSGTSSGTSGGSGTTSAPAPAQKEGWSKAAKGAAIGGATGAVAGAIISKKKGKGAIIGGILGAGGGYVIGRSKDKREGRY